MIPSGMKLYKLWSHNPENAYLVRMEITNYGVHLEALDPWGCWIADAWIYSAITVGWTGPASDCIEWSHEKLTKEEFDAAVQDRGSHIPLTTTPVKGVQ